MRAWREAVAWWMILVVLWLATLNSFSYQELVLCAALALPAAIAVPFARQAVEVCWRPRARWVRWLPSLVVGVLHDTVAVLWLARDRDRLDSGEFRRIPLDGTPDDGNGDDGDGDDARSAAHVALATATLSATPGSVVIADPGPEPGLLVHSLPIPPTRLRQAIRR